MILKDAGHWISEDTDGFRWVFITSKIEHVGDGARTWHRALTRLR